MAGPTITRITALTADPNMRRIDVDSKRVAILRATDVERLRLRLGMPWTQRLAEAVEQEQEANKARKKAMNLLGWRMYSQGELRDRLVRSGRSSTVANRILEELIADRWIDDTEYARELVRSLSRKKPVSKRLILEKLKSKRIAADLAETVALEYSKSADPLSDAMQLAKAQLSRTSAGSKSGRCRRIAASLARLGFDELVIEEALARLGLSDDLGTRMERHLDDEDC